MPHISGTGTSLVLQVMTVIYMDKDMVGRQGGSAGLGGRKAAGRLSKEGDEACVPASPPSAVRAAGVLPAVRMSHFTCCPGS